MASNYGFNLHSLDYLKRLKDYLERHSYIYSIHTFERLVHIYIGHLDLALP